MSLINDALRQVRQTQKSAPPPAAPPVLTPAGKPAEPPPMVPVEPPPLSPWPALVPVLLIAVVILALLGAGGWLVWKGYVGKRAPKAAAMNTNRSGAAQSHRTTNLPGLSPNAALRGTSASPVAAATSPPPAASAKPTNLVAATNPVPVHAPPVRWPALKLQGIIYRPPHSTAVINSKNYYLNDTVEGVRIVDISAYSVTIALGGQSNVLMLR